MPEPTASEPKRLEIRKYPNRRYYDSTHSKHLTLEEIRSLIREGFDVRVIDSKTSADITAQVLTQIILELDGEKLDLFPAALLVRLIRSNDQLVKDFIDRYFHQALTSFMEYQQQLDQHLSQTPGVAPFYSPLSAWSKAVFTPFGSPPPATPPTPTRSEPSSKPPQTAGGNDLRDVVASLQEQVAALQHKLAPSRAKPARSRAKGRSRK